MAPAARPALPESPVGAPVRAEAMLDHLILHIGTHETGTSSIQEFLAARRDALAARSICYPVAGRADAGIGSMSHHGLALAATDDGSEGPLAALADEVLAECGRDGCGTLLLSSEDLTAVMRPGVLAERLPARRTTIVVGLRPQHDAMTAMYTTALAFRQVPIAPKAYYETELVPYFDYYELLSRWRGAFPRARVLVRPFDRGRPARRDAVRDFLEALEIPLSPPVGRQETASNPTLPARGTVAMRALLELGLSREQFRVVFRLLHELGGELGEVMSVYSPDERRLAHEQFRATNRRVRRDFLDGHDADLFDEPVVEDEAGWQAEFGRPGQVERRVFVDFVRWLLARSEGPAGPG